MTEELKEFWEWCGWNWQTEKESLVGHRATVKYIDPPPVNLDNLFRYAVPELVSVVGRFETYLLLSGCLSNAILLGKKFEDEVYEAIRKVRKECQKG